MVGEFEDFQTPDFYLKLTMKLQDEIEELKAEIRAMKRERIKVYDSYEDLRIELAREANRSLWSKNRKEREVQSKIESGEIQLVEDLLREENT